MDFNSFHYAAFFLVMLSAVAFLRRRVTTRNILLLIASYYFYGCWDWRFLGLLWLSTLFDYGCGRLIDGAGAASRKRVRGRRERLILAASVVCSLGLLGIFKYYGFFAASAATALAQLGIKADLPTLRVILPAGISFYTFQTMSYVIDVYRGEIPAERNLLSFALYVAFFPQLVAGPIERPGRLLPQLARPTQITWSGLCSGFYLICSGLFKKVVLADNLAKAVDAAYAQADPAAATAMLAMYGFAIQVYCDFSGYTDIARGSARCMGFELTPNFNLPYFATSPADFWRRWHMSLSTWVRDYIYIPLGGSHKGTVRTYVNIMVMMVLMGLWHGAGWVYVVWGAFHGVLLCIHRALRPWMERVLNPAGRITGLSWHFCRVVVCFHVLGIAAIVFRSRDLHQAGQMLGALGKITLRSSGLPAVESIVIVLACGLLLLSVQILQQLRGDMYTLLRLPRPLRAVVYAGAILGFLAFGEYYGAQFIYFQF
ncbi:MAG: MBOAT family protein [Tepidisphaeraceae bacterium]|jgi:D-alanyl-lipoteichoic acid acyltransferase DltB (MBOAT superfamily)